MKRREIIAVLICVALVLFILGWITPRAVAKPTRSQHAWTLGRWSPGVNNVKNAVYFEFCGHRYRYCALGDEAWRVSDCETGGTFSVWATNGQYLGLFQMGAHERAMFGYGRDPWRQARGAKRYYDYALHRVGYGWNPWSCRP